MKYAKPKILALSSQTSAWCSKGSSGEAYDNSCGGGTKPTTTYCWAGPSNTTGHCIGGNRVTNQNPTAETYCNNGGSGHLDKACTSGTGATGNTGACGVGTSACHCWNGTNA